MHQSNKIIFQLWADLVGRKQSLLTDLLNGKQILARRQLSNRPWLKRQLTAFHPRQFRTRFGDYEVKEAVRADRTAVLNIRKDIYAGLDFLPDFYEQLVTPPNGKAFLVQNKDKIISFLSTMLIDESESCYVKGFRISEEHEKRDLSLKILGIVSDWAKTNGAKRFVGTTTDPNQRILRYYRNFVTMYHLIHLMQLENVCILPSDINSSNKVLSLTFSQLSTYLRSEEICNYLFPYNRILVDIVPYRLLEGNLCLMEEISGDHTVAFSDVHLEDNSARGLLSFGTIFRGQKVNYVYGIEIYGSDVNSVRKHFARHISYLKQRANGSVCFHVFSFDNFPKKLAGEICQQFGMERVNYPGTPYPQWNIQTEVLGEGLFDTFK